MMERKQLIHEEEAWAAFSTYLSAQQKILTKNPSTEKIQLLNQAWENLACTRKELDYAWAKNE